LHASVKKIAELWGHWLGTPVFGCVKDILRHQLVAQM